MKKSESLVHHLRDGGMVGWRTRRVGGDDWGDLVIKSRIPMVILDDGIDC